MLIVGTVVSLGLFAVMVVTVVVEGSLLELSRAVVVVVGAVVVVVGVLVEAVGVAEALVVKAVRIAVEIYCDGVVKFFVVIASARGVVVCRIEKLRTLTYTKQPTQRHARDLLPRT